ncbi:Photosystem I assembly protein Ycf3 [subsurface metagenome]
MPDLPTGTVTFLFTDIQGSTRLWQSYPHKMKEALACHDTILREAIEANNGRVFKTVGDAFCAVFDTAMNGLKAALSAQLSINSKKWDLPGPLMVRMALHAGEAEERDQDYYGPALNRVSRLQSIGHGGQTLVSMVTAELIRDMLPEDVSLKDLGDCSLKDLTRPETIFQLVHPDIPSEFPPLKSLDMHPHNLPMQTTQLIGREKELEAVTKMLLDENARIVTLTGTGGIGKTRLGLQVAAELIEFFKHGIFFVDLVPISDPGLLASVIAQTLKVRETGGRPLLDVVKDYLCDKHILLLLDNFEQIMEAELQVVQLLSACPGVRVLVTSREPLHVRGEKIFLVPPLQLPEAGQHHLLPVRELSQYEAVRLFIETAAAIKRDFQVTSQNAPAVAEICIRLDGIPLAIELAAARIKLLPPQAILKRLDHRLGLLTAGAHDLPARQQTLRATIDWSYDMLDTAHQMLFRTLAVFAGGFTIEAAEALGSITGTAALDVFNGVESLLDKNLLLLEEILAWEPRFRMLETIREYGMERLLESSEEERVRQRHAEYYLLLAEAAEPKLNAPKQGMWLDRLHIEYDNIRAALKWFTQKKDGEAELRLTGALWRFWEVRGYLTEGRDKLKKALEDGPDAPDRLRARALLGAGDLSRQQGDYDQSIILLEDSLALFQNIGDQLGVAMVYREIGRTYWHLGRLEQAHDYYTEGWKKAHELGEKLLSAMNLLGLGLINWMEGNLEKAQSQFEESRRIFVDVGDRRHEAKAINNLGIICYEMRDMEKAEAYFLKALEIQEEIGDAEDLRWSYNNLGYLYYRLGDYTQAVNYYEQLRQLLKDTGDKRMSSTALSGLSEVYLAMGDTAQALKYAQNALQEVQDIGTGIELGVSYRVLGEVWLTSGKPDKARDFFERSIPLLEVARDNEELEKARKGYEKAVSLIKSAKPIKIKRRE